MTTLATPNLRPVTRPRNAALAIGLAATLACVVAALSQSSRHDLLNAYLYAYMFWLGISLGSLALVMLHNLTGGGWGFLIRRIAQSAALVTPLMLLLFLPILLGMHDLFPWTNPEELAANEVLRHRQPYLNIPFFTARAAIYFIAWIALALLIQRLGKKHETHPTEKSRSPLRGWSAAGLIIYLLTATHAGYDWAMSRDTDFYSTTFGFIITTGQCLSALAFAILILAWSRSSPTLTSGHATAEIPHPNPPEASSPSILNDLGNILLTLVILWTYVSFMQLLVIWMGNTKEDNGYYIHRGLGQPSPWRYVALALILFHFFIPFFLLLFRSTKKYLPTLLSIAALLFLAHLLEQYWLIRPDPDGPDFHLTFLDLLTPLAIGGLWLSAFFYLLPQNLAPPQGVPNV